MASSPLHHFICRLEALGVLSRVAVPVDPVQEITAISNQVCKEPGGGKALLFEQVTGARFQVATNIFGSLQRVCLAFGVDNLNELTVRLCSLLDRIPEPDLSSLDRQIASQPEFSRFAPHVAPDPDPALIQMNPLRLSSFPFLQSWPEDGSAGGHKRYITLPQVFSADPDGGTQNCGVYRVQLRGEREVAIQWKSGSGAARHAELYRLRGAAMPVAIVLGGEAATLFSAMFPLPGHLDEMTFAGFLRGAPLTIVPCQSIPLQVPDGAEIVIEGYVEPAETVTEGPFGNHTGFYSPAAPAALMRITALRHRRDAIIPATVVGPPPMEDCWMAKAWERLLLAFLRKLVPPIIDIHFPDEWVFHQSAIISLENPHPGMVRDISSQLWALPWFATARLLLFVVSSGTETSAHAAWKVINVTDFNEDLYRDKKSDRIAIDATGCRLSRPEVRISAGVEELVARRWREYGLA